MQLRNSPSFALDTTQHAITHTKEIKQSYAYIFIILTVLSIVNFMIIQWMNTIQEQNLSLLAPIEQIERDIAQSHDGISLILHTLENHTATLALHHKVQAQLAHSADDLRRQLQILESINRDNTIPILSIDIQGILYQDPHQLKSTLTSLIANLRQLATLDPDQYYWESSLWIPTESALARQGSLSKNIEAASQKIHHNVAKKFTYLSRLHNLLIVVTLLLLLAESYYVFIPMLRTIKLRDTQFTKQFNQMQKYAYTDSLISNIGNRRALLLNMDTIRAHQNDTLHALLFVDIDKFRSINDAYGYAVGDYVLHETAQRIKDFLAHSDASLYRIDGNKYAVLISDASTANELPAYGLQLLDAIHAPLAYRGHTIRLDAHIGLTTYRPDQEASMESILDQADFALAASKKEKNTPIYSYSIENYQAAFGSKALARDLAAAIQNDKIIPYYQPIIDISSGKIVAVEALARWQKSDTEIVSPKSFLKIIKNHNLLKYMTESILRQVHHDYQQTQARGIPPIRMGVTFTKYLLIEPDLVSYLFEKIQGKSLDWLQIEISEDITIDQSRDIINHNLHLMQDLGAAITLDDYGTGHASLTHLLEFPCDTLKLDRSFALRALKDQRVKHVIDGIVRIADDLGVRVLISGVETQEQYDFFTQWPNVLMQGYHVASPMPWDECLGLCKQQGDIS